MKFCTQCGKSNADNSNFCEYCGKAFEAKEPPQTAETPNAPVCPHCGTELTTENLMNYQGMTLCRGCGCVAEFKQTAQIQTDNEQPIESKDNSKAEDTLQPDNSAESKQNQDRELYLLAKEAMNDKSLEAYKTALSNLNTIPDYPGAAEQTAVNSTGEAVIKTDNNAIGQIPEIGQAVSAPKIKKPKTVGLLIGLVPVLICAVIISIIYLVNQKPQKGKGTHSENDISTNITETFTSDFSTTNTPETEIMSFRSYFENNFYEKSLNTSTVSFAEKIDASVRYNYYAGNLVKKIGAITLMSPVNSGDKNFGKVTGISVVIDGLDSQSNFTYNENIASLATLVGVPLTLYYNYTQNQNTDILEFIQSFDYYTKGDYYIYKKTVCGQDYCIVINKTRYTGSGAYGDAVDLLMSLVDDYSYSASTTDSTSSVSDEASSESVKYKVTTKDGPLNIRSGPGTSFKVLGKVPKGAIVSSGEETNNWFKINYNGTEGWVNSNYLTETEQDGNTSYDDNYYSYEDNIQTRYKVTTKDGPLNIRSGPGKGYKVIGKVPKGATVLSDEETNNWFKISYNGTVGWVNGNYLTEIN